MFKPGGLLGPRPTPGRIALDQMASGGEDASGKDDKGSSGGGKKDDKSYSGSGFDPRGLERAAKAAQVCDDVFSTAARLRLPGTGEVAGRLVWQSSFWIPCSDRCVLLLYSTDLSCSCLSIAFAP